MSRAPDTILDEVLKYRGEKRSLVARLRSYRAQIALELSEVHWALLLANFFLAPLPKEAGGRIRAAAYRLIGLRIGRGTSIGKGMHIEGMGRPYGRLSIGEACWIRAARFELNERVTVGNKVVVSDDCLITTDTHEIGPPEQRFGLLTSRPVVIGDGAWICRKAMVIAANVGAGSIVASNAVVTKDVPPNTMVGGVPARVIRELPADRESVDLSEIDEQVIVR
jgi:maltose O-acetyltransferase